ncbi:MAG TPA: DUF2341 domain-containing protein [Bacteroidales bacterium]|nr:DUF2341 domain-containing protein [Bacteroidales bacterium]
MKMRTANNYRGRNKRVLLILIAGMISAQLLIAQGWSYRMPVTVTNPGTSELVDFQVQVFLNGDNFNFAGTLADGSDIRFTSDNGTAQIPFWIEYWDQANDTASIWIKVPSIPVGGTVVYLYYGNPVPTVPSDIIAETPPAGPYTKHPDNPIVPIDDPYITDGNDATIPGRGLLAENIVYDDVTGHYWMIFANYRSSSVGLVWSDDPSDPAAWHWHSGAVVTSANAPHLMKHNGTWYIYFSRWPNIRYATSATVNGTFTEPANNIVLSPSGDLWDQARVDEPYVFQRSDGTWIMLYMGDRGGATEQVGYAYSDNPVGPYTFFDNGNDTITGLCIPFGELGSFDAGTVADPWVIEYSGTYYIGYTVSPTKSGWSTAIATTTDWQTFTKHGVILPRGTDGNSFRGAVIRIGDEYVFPYTGDSYDMRIATQPVYQMFPNPVDNPDAVFDFFDDFNADTLNTSKWLYREPNDADQVALGGGLLTLTSTSTANYVRIGATSSFGFGYLGETRGRHPNPSAANMIVEYLFAQSLTNFDLRITDNFTALGRWQRYVLTDSASFGPPTDTDWHIFSMYRESPGTAGFMIDGSGVTVSTGVPVANLYPGLMSYGTSNQFTVDWTRVRKWAGVDPVVSPGAEENLLTQWTGAISNDWNVSGNWTAGVPAGYNTVLIPASSNEPEIYGPLEINSMNSLTLDPGGALTVTSDLTINGPLIIHSALAISGSLIVNGTSTGNITFNRQLKPGSDAASDWHLAAPPVATNADANTGKVSTVYEWSETAGTWTSTGITSTLPGHGYNIRQEEASDGTISFTGPIVNSDLTVAASSPYANAIAPDESYFNRTFVAGRSLANMGGSGWNLLGNPYPSAISANAFIGANYSATPELSQFDPNYVALYLFDGTERRYYYLANSTGWPSGTELSATHIQAGQGFFVLAMNDNSEFTFTRAMQEHSTATAMLKSSGETDDRWPGLQLKATHATGEVLTTVVYNGAMTTGVDPGYDVGLFKSGQDIELYTTLAVNDNGVNYTRQALPVSGADTLVIPVGVDFKDGGEVTFSAETVPVDGRRFWLEDRVAESFTDLSLKSYTVTLPADSYGTGRFFIIASTNTPTDINRPEAPEGNLRIWISGDRLVIQGEIGDGSFCGLFDLQGRKMLEQQLTDDGMNIVELPVELHGVVLVRVIDGPVVITRKLVIP